MGRGRSMTPGSWRKEMLLRSLLEAFSVELLTKIKFYTGGY